MGRRTLLALSAAVLAVAALPFAGVIQRVSAGDGPVPRGATTPESLEPGPTYTYEDQDGILVRGVNSGSNLNQYLYRSGGPISFSIDVNSSFGPIDADGFPVAGNGLYGRTGRLTLRVWDVDDDYTGTDVEPERDRVLLNGNALPGFLQGADGQWSVSTFSVDLNNLKLPTATNPDGQNEFEVDIDTANTGEVWAVEVASGELRLQTEPLRPAVFIHGIQANADGTNNMGEIRQFYDDHDPALVGHTANPTALGSFAAREATLTPTIDSLLAGAGASRVNLIGHSMGGLVARAYAHDHPDKVGDVTMLGTPNGGSEAADIVCQASNFVFPAFLSPCAHLDQELLELTSPYVQLMFNESYPDNPSVRFITLAGTADDAGWLEGEDDGIIRVAEAEYLNRDNPDHPGFHETRPHYDLGHDGLVHDASKLFPDTFCDLYPSTSYCSSPAGLTSTRQVASSESPATPSTLGFDQVVTVPAGSSVNVPVSFETVATARLVAFPADPSEIQFSFGGTPLARSDILGIPAFGLDLQAPTDGPVLVTNNGPSDTQVLVAALLDTTRLLTVSPDSTFAPLGTPVGVTVYLTDADDTDSPTLTMVSEDGSRTAIDLTENGLGTWGGEVAPGSGGDLPA